MNPVQALQDELINLAVCVPLICVFCVAVAYGVRCAYRRILDSIDGKDWQ